MVAAVTQSLGGVDVLVNNAAKPGGQQPPPRLAEITDDAFWSDVNVKVMGYLRCAREVAPLMATAGWGRIVTSRASPPARRVRRSARSATWPWPR